jgi:hypothetical protein
MMERGWIKTLRDNLCLYTTYKLEGQISTTGMVFANSTSHSLNLERSVRPSARSVDEFPIETYVNCGSLITWHRKLEVFPNASISLTNFHNTCTLVI